MQKTLYGDGWQLLNRALNDCAKGMLSAEGVEAELRRIESSSALPAGRFWINFDVLALITLCGQCRAELDGHVGTALHETAGSLAQIVANVYSGRESYEYGFIFGPEGETVDYSQMPSEISVAARFMESVVEGEIAGSGTVSKTTLARLNDLAGLVTANSVGATILRNQCRSLLPGGIYEGLLSRSAVTAVIDTIPEGGGLTIGPFRNRRYRECEGQFWGRTSIAASVTVTGATTVIVLEPINDLDHG